MPVSREFRLTVKERAERDPEFRAELLQEALEALLQGELDLFKLLTRDYINATEGLASVAEAMGKSRESVARMLSPSGNPNAQNLLAIVTHLRHGSDSDFSVTRCEESLQAKRKSKRNQVAAG